MKNTLLYVGEDKSTKMMPKRGRSKGGLQRRESPPLCSGETGESLLERMGGWLGRPHTTPSTTYLSGAYFQPTAIEPSSKV